MLSIGLSGGRLQLVLPSPRPAGALASGLSFSNGSTSSYRLIIFEWRIEVLG